MSLLKPRGDKCAGHNCSLEQVYEKQMMGAQYTQGEDTGLMTAMLADEGKMKWTDSLVRVLALSGQSAAKALAGAALQSCLRALLVPVEATQPGLEACEGHTGSCNAQG